MREMNQDKLETIKQEMGHFDQTTAKSFTLELTNSEKWSGSSTETRCSTGSPTLSRLLAAQARSKVKGGSSRDENPKCSFLITLM